MCSQYTLEHLEGEVKVSARPIVVVVLAIIVGLTITGGMYSLFMSPDNIRHWQQFSTSAREFWQYLNSWKTGSLSSNTLIEVYIGVSALFGLLLSLFLEKRGGLVGGFIFFLFGFMLPGVIEVLNHFLGAPIATNLAIGSATLPIAVAGMMAFGIIYLINELYEEIKNQNPGH